MKAEVREMKAEIREMLSMDKAYSQPQTHWKDIFEGKLCYILSTNALHYICYYALLCIFCYINYIICHIFHILYYILCNISCIVYHLISYHYVTIYYIIYAIFK